MQHSFFKLVSGAVVALLVLALLNVFFVRGAVTDAVANVASQPLEPLFQRFELFRSIVGGVTQWRELFRENLRLKEEILALRAERVRGEALLQENQNLRATLRLAERRPERLIDAGVFGLRIGPEGYRALLNKGSKAGVRAGDLVVSAQGALLGKVTEIHERTATVQVIIDPAFEITVKVGLEGTAGIAKGKGSDGLSLDLIVQEENVREGDIVLSSGSDLFPAALIVGTVDHVDENEGELFKKVRVAPAGGHLFSGTVFILQP